MIFLWMIIIFCLSCYGIVNWLPYLFHRYIFCDIPGPKAMTSHPPFEILCFHGANVDARIFECISDVPAWYAPSLGNHEKGSQHACMKRCIQDVIQVLEQFPSVSNIVTHSTGFLWLASAYHQRPDLFSNRIIWALSPNLGLNLRNHTSVQRLVRWLPRLGIHQIWDRPPYLACRESSIDLQKISQNHYQYGMRMRMCYVFYYQKLLKYMENPETQQALHRFLSEKGQYIHIVDAEEDHLLDIQYTQSVAQTYQISYIRKPGSHQRILMHLRTLGLRFDHAYDIF